MLKGEKPECIQTHRLVFLQERGYVGLTAGQFDFSNKNSNELSQAEDFLTSSGCHTIIGYVAGPDLPYVKYDTPAGCDFDIFDADARLTQAEPGVLRPGETLILDGYTQVLDWNPDHNSAFLVVASDWVVSQSWSYSSGTLAPLGASLCEQDDSILLAMLAELKRVGLPSSVAPVASLLDHGTHQIRWKAAEVLGSLDHGACRDAVRLLRSDAHPHVRAAADKAWQANFANHADTRETVSC